MASGSLKILSVPVVKRRKVRADRQKGQVQAGRPNCGFKKKKKNSCETYFNVFLTVFIKIGVRIKCTYPGHDVGDG